MERKENMTKEALELSRRVEPVIKNGQIIGDQVSGAGGLDYGNFQPGDRILSKPRRPAGNRDLEIVAGPCQISPENLKEIYQMAEIRVNDGKGGMQRALYGERFVGLKSRTMLNGEGEGMGIDFPVISEQMLIMPDRLEVVPPSVQMAEQFVKDTDLLVATEVMMPDVQLPFYEGKIPAGKLMLWNPSVNQLGWQIAQTANIARRNDWLVGIKNGKALDIPLAAANEATHTTTSLENTWVGLSSYARDMNGQLILIHRGADTPEKGLYRSAPVHEIAKRAKERVPDAKLYFDPSHSFGQKLRDDIVEGTISAMLMTDEKNNFLYDGILIEVGTSDSDTGQHITVNEFEDMVKELARYRKLRTPESSQPNY